MVYDPRKTIFALSSANFRSAIHVHRVSGYGCLEKLHSCLKTSKGSHFKKDIFNTINQKPITKRAFLYRENSLVDDILFTYFKSPHSYTGEDVIELYTHGNPLITQEVQSLFRRLGFEDALPGEFTQRAFLNGKMDLTQAEAIHLMIQAESQGELQLSQEASQGHLSSALSEIREKIIGALAYFEAHIDFGSEDVGDYHPETQIDAVAELKKHLISLSQSYEYGLKLRTGIKIAMCGKPNAGKSSLYNALLQKNRAIVTDVAGTTRDVLEDRFVIENKDFVLLDTAGLRKTNDSVEQIGIKKALSAIEESDVAICVIDGSRFQEEVSNIWEEEQNFFKQTFSSLTNHSFKKINLISKSDLIPKEIFEKLPKDVVVVCEKNTEPLRQALLKIYDETFALNSSKQNATILLSSRQKDQVEKAIACLGDCQNLIEFKDLSEKISSKLQESLHELQIILGDVTLDNIYDKIFSSFCIGK